MHKHQHHVRHDQATCSCCEGHAHHEHSSASEHPFVVHTSASPAAHHHDAEDDDDCGCACGCHAHAHGHSGHGGHDHDHGGARQWWYFGIAAAIALLTWGVEIAVAQGALSMAHPEWLHYGYLLAYIPASLTVWGGAWKGLRRGQVFNEFFLMLVATVGALCLGDFPEAVGVMLFYLLGENLQGLAVGRARRNIAALVALRPEDCAVIDENSGTATHKSPAEVAVGSVLRIDRGARIPLDGQLIAPPSACEAAHPYAAAQFNTAALTGESMARSIAVGERVMAGYIVTDRPIFVRTDRALGEDALSRILQMVEDAAARKAPAERMLTKVARIYTPIVVALAALLIIVPALVQLLVPTATIELGDWVYRALVFLVASCPCALVLSVPLSYFAGIGRASRRGVLFKGGAHLDAVTHIDTVVFDKTGTLTTGQVTLVDGMDSGAEGAFSVSNDEARPTSGQAVQTLRKMGLHTVMLSGDYAEQVDALGRALGLDEWHSRLLPEEKLQHVERLMQEGRNVAFVGDGINDAPVLARAHVGFAMGASGTDAAVETADVVLATDDPLRVVDALRIGRSTRRLVWENILLAVGIKAVVLVLSAFGLAGMWAAVFADTGVVLLCVLNVLRPRR